MVNHPDHLQGLLALKLLKLNWCRRRALLDVTYIETDCGAIT